MNVYNIFAYCDLVGRIDVIENDDADALIHVAFIDFIRSLHVFEDPV